MYWSLRIRSKKHKFGSPDHQSLSTGAIVRLRCLESDSLLWTPSALSNFIIHGHIDAKDASSGFESFWHSSSVSKNLNVQAVKKEELNGVILPNASFRAIFVLEALKDPYSLELEQQILHYGQAFRLRHYLSGCYLAVLPTGGVAVISRPIPDTHRNISNQQIGDSTVDTTSIDMDSFDEITAFIMVSTQSKSTHEPIKATSAIGWLQTYTDSKCLHSSGEIIVAEIDERTKLQSLLPVLLNEDDKTEIYSDSFVEHQKTANTAVTLVDGCYQGDILQFEVSALIMCHISPIT